MLLGRPLTPSTTAGWRAVEDDLHGIAGRVVEYDADARLVREDGTGHLGLMRWQNDSRLIAGGYWAFVRTLHDLDTDLPLKGEPDGRVIRWMRSSDSRGRDLRKWAEQSKHAHWMREKRTEDAMRDENREHAERFVSALRKDVTARPRAVIPADVPKAA